MNKCWVRGLAAMVALVLGLQCPVQGQNPTIEKLRHQIQGMEPDQVRNEIVRRLGPPQRDVGSGVQIEQWDIDGGVLTFHSVVGPSFVKHGATTYLIQTNNPIAQCLFGSYEMTTRAAGQRGMQYWLGNLNLSDEHYTFTDSNAFPEERRKQHGNFFIVNPSGLLSVKYSAGITPVTRLEELPDGTVVATVMFSTTDHNHRSNYEIVTNRSTRSISFRGKNIAFNLRRG